MTAVDPTPNPYAAPSASSQLEAMSYAGTILATRGERFAGSLIDTFILLPIAFPLAFGVGMVAAMSGADTGSPLGRVTMSLVGGVISVVVFMGINGYLLANRGQTVGKMIMKTMIVSDATDQKLPLGRLLVLRYLPIWILSSLPYVGFLVSIANALAIFRENRKCLHDDIAGTKVIKLLQ